MKIFLTIVLCFYISINLFCQDYDIQWIQGPRMSLMDFRNDSITFHHISDTISAFLTTGNICDKNGNFLFFTNGIYVRDRNGAMMSHGDSLSFYNPALYDVIYDNGAPQDQGVLILPKPDSENLFLLFHYSTVDTSYGFANQVNYDPLFFYYSIVDINANNGLGDVIQKNIKLPVDSMMCSSRLTAVKHGNGRDWWVVRHGQRDNKYIKFLVTAETILGPYYQYIGPNFNQNEATNDFDGASIFSQSGDKMATGNGLGPIVVLDFDRCSGQFSNPVVINNKLQDTTFLGIVGLALSPNGRFLYANNIYELNQYDLNSTNPNDSIRLYTVDSTDNYWMHAMRLGPNNKIYIATWHGGNDHLHVINDPDKLGVNSNFQFKGQLCIAQNTWNLPNMVNYRLGKLEGSPCDTLISFIAEEPAEPGMKVFPNPATKNLVISYNDLKWDSKEIYLEIVNQLGQVVYHNGLPFYSAIQEIDVSAFPSGFYITSLKTNSTLIAVSKFAKR